MAEVAAERIYIQRAEDWPLLRARGLTTVVDPMVLRTGDVFLRGRRQIVETDPRKNTDAMWDALRANLGSLATFFDMLVLRPALPVFDYESTFPVWDMETWQGRAELIDMCNQGDDPVLVPVSIAHDVYQGVKAAAVGELALDVAVGRDGGGLAGSPATPLLPDPDSELGRAVVAELSAFDYEWKPELPGLGLEPPDSSKRALATFLFGGLLFGGYAQLLGGDHVLQPGRSKLFLAVALRQSQRALDEDLLFQKAFPAAKESPFDLERIVELPRTPSVLPYLLTFGDRTPGHLLERALRLRSNDAVKQLRDRLAEIGDEIDRGFVSPATEKELTELGAAARAALSPTGRADFDLELKLDAALVPAVGVGIKVNPARLLGWFLAQLPSRRYRKLLVRMVIAQRSYTDIAKHVQKLWTQ